MKKIELTWIILLLIIAVSYLFGHQMGGEYSFFEGYQSGYNSRVSYENTLLILNNDKFCYRENNNVSNRQCYEYNLITDSFIRNDTIKNYVSYERRNNDTLEFPTINEK